jgi:membrane protease YdiL (CAAX protease family)
LPPRGGAWLALLLAPAFVLLISGVAAGWGWLASRLGLTLTTAAPMDTLPAAILLDALLPAVCEELFCRGGVYSTLRPLGRRVAIPASALIFALMHASVAQIPYALLAGLILSLLYELTGGLAIPMILHFLTNLVSLFLLFKLPLLPIYLTLAGLTAVSLAVLILLWRRVGLPLPEREPPVPGAWHSLLFSPLAVWLILILSLTVL